MLLFLVGTKLLKLMEIWKKTEVHHISIRLSNAYVQRIIQ
jgi:hypothetical protein